MSSDEGIMMVSCECGCGKEVKPGNKFVNGHNSRGKSWKWIKPQRKIVDGYVMIKNSQGKYIPEHRLIMEEYLGRRLEPEEVSHHIDEITTHNVIENLELCLRQTHAAYHHTGRKRPEETKNKIAEKLKGNQNTKGIIHSEESRKRCSERMKGNTHGSANKGRKNSEEAKQRMRDARKRYLERAANAK